MKIRSLAVPLMLALLALLGAPIHAAPNITISATSVTLLGVNAPCSLTAILVDPNHTGKISSGGSEITVLQTSTVTPGDTCTVGPLFGNDAITDGFGNLSTTYYKIQVFLVNNGVIASSPSLQAFYAFQGSGTVDLSTATPLAPSFMAGPSGNVVVPGSLTASQFISTVATGTAPLSVTSTTVVPNLNAQLHNGKTAPAGNIVGDTDTQTLSGKTFDISTNTLKNSSNTAGHVLRNNGTKYVDAQLGFADLSGTASTAQIGTGTPAAGKYVDGGTGAWTAIPATGVSEAPLVFPGGGAGTGGVAEQTFLKTLLPSAHTVIRFTVAVVVQGSGCTTAPVVALWDATAGSALTSLTISNSTAFFDSGVISVAFTAGHQIDTKVTTAALGCGTQPTLGNMVAVYQ